MVIFTLRTRPDSNVCQATSRSKSSVEEHQVYKDCIRLAICFDGGIVCGTIGDSETGRRHKRMIVASASED